MKDSEEFESLFSYGTLQDEEVQLSTFGRTLVGERDALSAYTQRTFGPYLNIEFTGETADSVEGTRFKVTSAELEEADIYEATAIAEHMLLACAWILLLACAWILLQQYPCPAGHS